MHILAVWRLQNTLSGIPSERQLLWIQVRPDILSGLIWVQTVSKDYQQGTLAGKVLICFLCDNFLTNRALGVVTMAMNVL